MKILPVILVLCLTVLSVLPSTIPRAHAPPSNGNNYWSPFGPRTDNLLYKVYSDFTAMFTDFNAGQLDITDWPIQAGDLAGFLTGPNSGDFFVTSPQGEFGIFQLDINHHNTFLGVAQQAARTTVAPSLTISAAACGACPANSFQLIVNLKNNEEGGAAVLDINNLVTATITGASTPTATKADDGGLSPTGTYTVGVLSNVPASYVIATSLYGGSITLFTSGTTAPVCLSGQSCTASFNVNYNSPSTKKATDAAIQIGRGLAHLLDKPSYLTGSYLTPSGASPLADCVDVQAPPAQNLLAGAGACNHSSTPDSATLNADCASHGLASPCATSLFNLSPDSCTGAVTASCPVPKSAAFSLVGYSGLTDLKAACEHFVAAGFTATGTCTAVAAGTAHLVNPLGSCNTATAAGCIVAYVRTHPPRRAFGSIFADSLNYLFGTPAPVGGTICWGGPPSFSCSPTPVYFTISQIASIVFSVATLDDYNIYTGGFSLGSTPDHLWALYHSQFASNVCGGAASTFPNNYPMFCDAQYDTQANAGEFVPGVTFPAFQRAAVLGATRGSTIAVYSGVNRFVGLNSWSHQPVGAGTGSSLVSVKGHGFESASGFTLNARPVPGYVPGNPLYYASGCKPSTGCEQNTIRRSMAQTTLHISPYVSTTVWEFEPQIQFYDSMLAVDPNTGGLCQTQPGGTANCIDWMTTSHSASFDAGTNHLTQTWNLRNDINFHDGVAVTAHDVCFSILSYRDAPSANFFPSVSNVVSCSVVSSNIAQVTLTGNSPFDELNIGGLFIVPEHVWANPAIVPGTGGLIAGTDQVVTPSALASPTFDPVAAGAMVGSAAWVCNPSAGVSTISGQASCTQNANGSPGGQAVGAGGRILLQRNLGYMRCCADVEAATGKVSGGSLPTTDLQALEWADANKDGKVTILDIAAAASAFGTSDPYFAHPAYDPGRVVSVVHIAIIASFFDHGITAPFLGTPTGPHQATPNAALASPTGANPGIDPQTDPYQLSTMQLNDQGSCNKIGAVTCALDSFQISAGETWSISANAQVVGIVTGLVCTEAGGTIHTASIGATAGPSPIDMPWKIGLVNVPLAHGCIYKETTTAISGAIAIVAVDKILA